MVAIDIAALSLGLWSVGLLEHFGMTGESEPGSPDVPEQHPLRFVGIPAFDGVHEQVVLEMYRAVGFGPEEAGECAAVVLGGIPEAQHRLAENTGVGTAVAEPVEVPVESQE